MKKSPGPCRKELFPLPFSGQVQHPAWPIFHSISKTKKSAGSGGRPASVNFWAQIRHRQ